MQPSWCNNALGDFEDDPDRLMAAAAYVDPGMRDPDVTRAIAERLEGLKELGRAAGY